MACSFPECGKKVLAKGLCVGHYSQLSRGGELRPLKQISPAGYRATCSAAECSNKSKAHGLCQKHYERTRNGYQGRTASGELERWLLDHADYRGDGCLIWPFHTGRDGYGRIRLSGTGMTASRAMCILAHGHSTFGDVETAHSCGKGHDGCVHPLHVSWKTSAENKADKLRHGTVIRGEKSHKAKLTEAQVLRVYRDERTHRTIAATFECSRALVGDIKHGRAWAWLTGHNGGVSVRASSEYATVQRELMEASH